MVKLCVSVVKLNTKKAYAIDNEQKLKDSKRKYYVENKEVVLSKHAEYRENNKDTIAISKNAWYEKNKKSDLAKKKIYRDANKDSLKIKQKIYYEANKSVIIKRQNVQVANRCKVDPLFALYHRIRNSIKQSIINNKFSKNSNTKDILGCTFEEFKIWIENQFQEGMNWENRSEWHIDHIYPVSKAIDMEHMIKLNHYTNLQPLWAEDNLKKGNKIPKDYFI